MSSKRYGSAFFATITGIADRLRPARPDGTLRDEDRLDDATAFVTGACSGLGLAIAQGLARRGAKVLMGCRGHRSEALASVARAASGPAPELVALDLASLADVSRAVDELAGQRLDVIVLNAGVVPARARRTRDGFEEGFQVNYLANAALLRGLLERRGGADAGFAEPRDAPARRPRVIFVSSEAHRSGSLPPWRELGSYYDYTMGATVAEYGRTKLLLTTYAEELARRLGDGAGVYALCPGAVNTQIGREAPRWARPLLALTFRLFFAPPEVAAQPVIYLACAPRFERETGVYLHGMTRKQSSESARSPQNGAALWEATGRLLGQTRR